MSLCKKTVALAACLTGLFSPAMAADIYNNDGYGSYKDGPSNAWIVTVGGYGASQPTYKGADKQDFAFVPIFDIRRAGEKEALSLPNESITFALFDRGNFTAGFAANIDDSRYRDDDKDVRGLRGINTSVELGAFAEYWAAPFLRTRLDLLQAVNGNNGFLANLSADYVYTPSERWQFTVGPRLKFVNAQYNSAYFGVKGDEVATSGLPAYHAGGGLHSFGGLASARYNWSERFSIRAYAEYEKLEGDAADSPLVRLRGSEDQFEFGVGAAYAFSVTPPAFLGR